MRRIIYAGLTKLPAKAFSISLALGGIISSLWPKQTAALVSSGMTEADGQAVGAVLLGLAALYFFLLWVLKPTPPAMAGSSAGQTTTGSYSPNFGGPNYGTINYVGSEANLTIGVPDVIAPAHEPEPSRPGLSIHFVGQVHFQSDDRRKYLISLGGGEANSAAVYLTASNQFTFAISDQNGEIYSVETVSGRAGIPYSEWIILSAELAILDASSILRLSVDGKCVAERTIPFAVRFNGTDWINVTTVAADQQGINNARLDLGALLTIGRHLSSDERDQLFGYWATQWKINL